MAGGGSSPSEALRRLTHGYQVSQALYVAAMLGVADRLAAGQTRLEELALATGTHAPTLYRLLRLLASIDVFAEEDAGRFRLTPLAECLRSDVPDSQRAWTIMVCGPSFWSSWGDLMTSVKTGESAFPRVHGMDRWDYLVQHPEENAVFNASMTANTALESARVAGEFDFSRFGLLVDVGGGAGGLLAAILVAYPSMRGILFDQPHVVEGGPELLKRAGVADRCEILGGNFFESVPGGADAYLLKSVIHDWENEQAVEILRTCRSAMAEEARLLLVERVIRPGNASDPAKFMDLLMLVMNGGRERTADEFGGLLGAAGFRLSNLNPTSGPLCVIEAAPA